MAVEESRVPATTITYQSEGNEEIHPVNRRIALYSVTMTSLLFLAGLSTASAKSPAIAAAPLFTAASPGDVFPVNSRPLGRTYGEWTVAYWQWAMSIPFENNPWVNDSTGEFAGVGQNGPVWFLGGTLGDSATRDFTMPAGKLAFLPVNQWIFGATVFDCEPSIPGVVCDVPTLRAAAAAAADATTHLEVFIDGNAVSDLIDYRAVSPSAFSLTLPEDSVPSVFGAVGPEAGTYAPHVSDGYYLMLKPLGLGEHVIFVHVESALGFEYDITYNINVVPRAR